jgi:hypothetical protein
MDTERDFKNDSTFLHNKYSEELGTEGTYFNTIMAIYDKSKYPYLKMIGSFS